MNMTRPVILKEHSHKIGGFIVGRLLPASEKKMIGPFIFMDHMGPDIVSPGKYIEVGQHPHIGLSTLTWLLQGEFLHKDNLGSEQIITPGSVNWMTAGRGIVHVEKTSDNLKDGAEHPVHGYQIWVALPREHEDTEPSFHHTPKKDLPHWTNSGLDYTLIAGNGFGQKSPVPVYSDLFMLQVRAEDLRELNLAENLKGEIGVCVVEGSIKFNGEVIEKNHILFFEDCCNLIFTIAPHTHLLLIGGVPLAEGRHMDWNFVHTSKEKIAEAKDKWLNRQFTMVENETSYMPLP